MSWVDGPMLAYDCETTGTDPEEARIVTACAVLIEGSNVAAHNWLVNPGIEIPAEAIAVHGITNEHAREHGVSPALAVMEIASMLAEAWAEGIPVVIMSAPFDLTILDRESRRHLGVPAESTGPVLDPRVIDKHLDDVVGFHRRGSRKLVDLAAHYMVKLEGAHTAEGDCMAAARVVWRMAKAYPDEIGNKTLEQLHGLQAWWHAEQCRSLQEYFDRKGQVEIVDPSWPVRSAA